jgi:hypothetical protein
VLEVPEHVLRASENSPHDSTPSPLPDTVALRSDSITSLFAFLLQRACVVIYVFFWDAMHDYLEILSKQETQSQARQALKGLK